MSCLRIDQIYLFLEKELSPSENKKIKEHLSSCSKCKKAVEERKILLQAAESLPLWKTPPNFTQHVMSAVFLEKVTFRSWLTTVTVGIASLILTFLFFFLFSGQSLVDLFVSLNSRILNTIQNFTVSFAKLVKLVTLFGKIIYRFIEFLFKSIAQLTSIISPEVQITLIILTLILSASLFYGVSRKLLSGEKI